MISAPETRLPASTRLGRSIVIAGIAATLLAAAGTDARAQASAPAAAASAAKASHAPAKAKGKAAAKKKKKGKPVAVRDDDAPDSFLYGRRDDVLAFAAQVAEERGLDRAWVEDQLARARYQPSVAKAIMPGPAGTAKNWAAYRARFIEPKRLAAGVQWWQAHAATLAFDFPTGRSDRSAFYRSELRAFLVWCALEGREADSVRGSFAGAIGWPQFMPSSLLKYAVDYDHDGHVDMASGGDDVIGSIASYFATYGWQPGMPTTFPAQPPADPAERARLVAADIVPTFTAAQLIEAGAQLPDAARDFPGLLGFVELQNGDDPPSFVASTRNFYIVTRYNWSAYYAMAVIDLGTALKREMALAPAARTLAN